MRPAYFLALAAIAAAAPVRSEAIDVRIVSPSSGAGAVWRTCIMVEVSDPSAVVDVVVKDPVTGNHYIQQKPALLTVSRPARLRTMIYLGEDEARFDGARFEVTALVNAKRPLAEGAVFSSLPAAEARSATVDVVRRRGADSWCDADAAGAARATLTPAANIGSSRPETAAPGPAPQAAAVSGLAPQAADTYRLAPQASVAMPARADVRRAWVNRLWAAVASLFLVLVIAPAGRKVANESLRDVGGKSWAMLPGVVERVVAKLGTTFTATRSWLQNATKGIWAARGYRQAPLTQPAPTTDPAQPTPPTLPAPSTFKTWLEDATTSCALALAVALAFAADALAMVQALPLVFQIVAPVQRGVLGDLLANTDPTVSNALGSPDGSLGSVVVALLRDLWSTAVGFMAMGVVAAATALGLVLLYGCSRQETAKAKLSTLWRERRLATECYVGLVVGMAVLAGYRAYELSPSGVPPAIPIVVAVSFAAAMPWVVTAAVHSLVRSLAAATAPIVAGLTIAVVVCAGALAFGVWAGAATAFLAVSCGALFTLTLLAYGIRSVFWLVECVAEGTRNVLHGVRGAGTSGIEPLGARARARYAAVAIVALGLLVPSAVVKAENLQEPHHDASKPYTALAVCIDTSTSVLPQELAKAKGILRQTIAHDVASNSVIWLIRIDESDPKEVQSFPLPYQGIRRSERALAEQRSTEVRQKALDAIEALSQKATRSQIHECVLLALRLLQGAPGATARVLVVISDFAQDVDKNVSLSPPPQVDPTAAAGVRAVLFVARPTDQTLDRLRMSRDDLFKTVKTEWAQYMTRAGAAGTVVQLVDGVVVE